MGERAKKKCAAESRACKAKKATEEVSQLEEIPASTDPSRSNAGNSKKARAAPSSATRQSTRLLSSSSKLESGGKRTSAKGNDESTATRRPQRPATTAAKVLLQELKINETDSEEDPDGELMRLI